MCRHVSCTVFVDGGCRHELPHEIGSHKVLSALAFTDVWTKCMHFECLGGMWRLVTSVLLMVLFVFFGFRLAGMYVCTDYRLRTSASINSLVDMTGTVFWWNACISLRWSEWRINVNCISSHDFCTQFHVFLCRDGGMYVGSVMHDELSRGVYGLSRFIGQKKITKSLVCVLSVWIDKQIPSFALVHTDMHWNMETSLHT